MNLASLEPRHLDPAIAEDTGGKEIFEDQAGRRGRMNITN